MNKKGFTLIELLAIIIIIGAITTIAIVSITNSINKSKDESFIDLAKNYVESARTMRAEDKLFYEPRKDEAIIIPYSEITGTEISHNDVTGYGKILPEYCFIGIVNNNGNYVYYINQVDDSDHILAGIDSNTVSKADIALEGDFSKIKGIKTPFSTFSVNYGNSSYSVKAIGVEFDADYVKDGNNKFITSFNIKEQNKNFKGILSLYSWTSNSSSKKIELKIINNQIGELSNKTYTFKKTTSGAIGEWYAIDNIGNQLRINGYPFILDVKEIGSDYVNFTIKVGNKIPYTLIRTTTDTTLYGYFYSDSSYSLSNAQIKGSISIYDGFALTGKFQSTNSNTVTIDGVNYKVNDSKVSYIIAKK